MSFIYNIQSVAKYESKILVRSWFFRIFTILAILFLGFFMGVLLLSDNSGGTWNLKAIPSNIPYIVLLLLNTGQAVIAVFLSSEFLKRDKKLDTSEVFYVHPLSNAEYVFGKIWGNLRVFLLLNFIIMALTLILNAIATNTYIDWGAYLQYFLIISVPTLIFIIGLSIFLMLVLKNQALTFVILLGYIGLTVFYIGDKFYYLFDYMAYSLPLMKSTIVGLTNYETIFNHRGMYLFAGLAFIFLTISLFNRLPNSRRSNYPWLVLGSVMLVASIGMGYNHVYSIIKQDKDRKLYTEINNKYINTPKMVVDEYDIFLEQHPGEITSKVKMKGTALASSSVFAFCLNPGLQVTGITSEGHTLQFDRDNQVILVDFGRKIATGDVLELSVSYKGRVNDNFCYLDIAEEVLQEERKEVLMNVDKKYAFQTADYLMFTPETYWYPRPGVAYSDKNPDWQQTYFSNFRLTVKPLAGLTPISQGESVPNEDGSFNFMTANPFQAISLAIGKYYTKSIEADSVLFNVTYLEGHDYFSHEFDSIQDTISWYIKEIKQNFERTYKLDYPFKRFSVVEVPAQFKSYPRSWTQAQETVQPEMVFFPEKGWEFYQLDFSKRKKDHIRWSQWDGAEGIDENEAQRRALNEFLYTFYQTEIGHNYSSGQRGRYELTSKANPYFLFPQLYNFRYNIFSSEWPVANRIIELYLQNRRTNDDWEREVNGISNNEKANKLFAQYSFKDLQGNIKVRDILDNIIALKANELFSKAEISAGLDPFRDTVRFILARNTFENIKFESLLDTLQEIGNAEIVPLLQTWYGPTALPYYTVHQPQFTQITNRGKDFFVTKQKITNDSPYDGIIKITNDAYSAANADPKTNRKVLIEANQTKEFVSVADEAPRSLSINTEISDNLPGVLMFHAKSIIKENGRQVPQEGDFVISASSFTAPNEIIVDNEDPLLFELSKPAVVGMLPKWLDKVEETPFKYSGVMWWRAPLQWTATTDGGYYGRYVRSAYVVKNGDGSQTATWKVPIPEPGQYEVYYWAYNKMMRYNRRKEGEYHFKIEYNNESEDAYLDFRQAGDEWAQVGVYHFDTDTVRIVLTNESKIRAVVADAVKLVKR